MNRDSDCYAIIPAAGKSERMGRAKLLLSWPTVTNPHATVLDRVLQAWTSSKVVRTIVVTRSDADSQIQQICNSYPVDVIVADDPYDMKESCWLGIQHISSSRDAIDRFFVCPADIPGITSFVIDRLMKEADFYQQSQTDRHSPIIVPTFRSKRGHPVLFPWTIVPEVLKLARDEGLNTLVNRAEVVEVEFSLSPETMQDIDTPDDYARAIRSLRIQARSGIFPKREAQTGECADDKN